MKFCNTVHIYRQIFAIFIFILRQGVQFHISEYICILERLSNRERRREESWISRNARVSPLFRLAFPIIDSGAGSEIASCKAGANYIEVLSDYKFVAAISCLWLVQAFERLLGDASPEFNRLHFETTSEIDLRRIFVRRVQHPRPLILIISRWAPEILRQSSHDTLHGSLYLYQRDISRGVPRETWLWRCRNLRIHIFVKRELI